MAVRTGMIRKQVSNQSGISLVEVMISAMIAAGISLTVAQISVNLQKGIKGAERSGDWIDLKGAIRRGLSSRNNCTRLFSLPALAMSSANIASRIPAAGYALPQGLNIGTQAAPQLLNVGATFGSGLRVVRTELRNPVQDTGNADLRWTADLVVEASTERNPNSAQRETYGASTRTEIFQISFTVEEIEPPLAGTPFDSCVGSDSDVSGLTEEVLGRVPKDTWVIGQTAPYDCYASNGAQLQACIDEPGSTNGPDGTFSRVLIKAGTYTSVSNLTLRSGYTYDGVPGRTIFQESSSGGGENAVVVIPVSGTQIAFRGISLSTNNSRPYGVRIKSGASTIQIENNNFTVRGVGIGVYFEESVTPISNVRVQKNYFTVANIFAQAIAAPQDGVRVDHLFIEENTVYADPAVYAAASVITLGGRVSHVMVLRNVVNATGLYGFLSTGRVNHLTLSQNEFIVRNGIEIRGSVGAGLGLVESVKITENNIVSSSRGVVLQDLPLAKAPHVVANNTIFRTVDPPTLPSADNSVVGIGVFPLTTVLLSGNGIAGFGRGIDVSSRVGETVVPGYMYQEAKIESNSIQMTNFGIVSMGRVAIHNNSIQAHSVGIDARSGITRTIVIAGNRLQMRQVTGFTATAPVCRTGGAGTGMIGICSDNGNSIRVYGNTVLTPGLYRGFVDPTSPQSDAGLLGVNDFGWAGNLGIDPPPAP